MTTGCSSGSEPRARPSPNQDERPAGGAVDTLVLHYTGMQSARLALDRLRDPAAKVSAHWLVDEDGTILALVPEGRRAWHAGVSAWAGRSGLNGSSIGVEIVNPGHEWGYRPFPEAQILAVIRLCRGILRRWPIPPARVLAHSDIAPNRKTDPGELFPWARLAAAGIGRWPEAGGELVADPGASLRAIGYPVDLEGVSLELALAAFQRRYRPRRVDGLADPETCRLLGAVERLQLGNAS
ncbi:N-acetylmuramoyl-L-alanine amidase [Geminicoccus harenae]|uniref:N-acetylmuramoyl-L-alanine amidase n=1 Tax=Geminicoccus harenae TaxID=2498453 RepID=UPI00168B2AAA|nr:N-acetylmuramoyl-L-alanine amidase [Geminicoccus harenae]